jgi:histidyl-tRNA synthetase
MTDTVKGAKDFLGEDARKRELIKDILVRKFKIYGFEPAETPIMEYEEFVKGENASDEAVSDIFKLQDRGERKLALRYEFTFQLKRIAQNKKLPYKRYQIGEVFRDEPTGSNRFRQFTQCDIDIIGSTIKDEAEILAMTSSLLKELGIKSTIYFNNRKLLNEILDKEGIKNKEQVMREIDKLDKLTEKEVKDNLKKYKAEKLVQLFKKPESYFKKYDSYKEIKELKDYCKDYKVNVVFQPSLARGLSYYNGTVFEAKTKDVKESITGGGSYSINGISSTGISFGLDRLYSLAKINAPEKRVLIISIGQDEKSIKLSESLRKNSIPCLIMYNKVSKALEFANSYALPYVIFLGADEAKKKKVKLRDMKSGKEEFISENDLIKKLSN